MILPRTPDSPLGVSHSTGGLYSTSQMKGGMQRAGGIGGKQNTGSPMTNDEELLPVICG